MSAVLDFIEEKPPQQREIFLFIHDLMLSYDGIVSKIRFGIPFYYRNSWVSYANPLKKSGVEFVFLRANEFEQQYRDLLDAKGRKQVAGMTIIKLEDIPNHLEDLIEEALRIDTSFRYRSKRLK